MHIMIATTSWAEAFSYVGAGLLYFLFFICLLYGDQIIDLFRSRMKSKKKSATNNKADAFCEDCGADRKPQNSFCPKCGKRHKT